MADVSFNLLWLEKRGETMVYWKKVTSEVRYGEMLLKKVARSHHMFGLKRNCSHVLPQDSKFVRYTVDLCRVNLRSWRLQGQSAADDAFLKENTFLQHKLKSQILWP
ncbi:hypothetical protein PO909_032993 [Leuciscus waleckii]